MSQNVIFNSILMSEVANWTVIKDRRTKEKVWIFVISDSDICLLYQKHGYFACYPQRVSLCQITANGFLDWGTKNQTKKIYSIM